MSLLWSLFPTGGLVAKNDTVGVPTISFAVGPLAGNRTARIWCRVNPAIAAEQGLEENSPATALLRLNKALLPPYTAYGTAYVGANKNGRVEEPVDIEVWEIDALFGWTLEEEDEEDEDAAAAAEIKVERPRRASGPPDRFVP
jgi:hypothetical protein